jgi:hypothetical protein
LAAAAVLSGAALAATLPLACVSNDNAAPTGQDAGVDASQPLLDSSGSDTSLPDTSPGTQDAGGDTASEVEAAGPPVVEVIGQGLSSPDQLVTDTTFLYITETLSTEAGTDSRIVRCPIAGCGSSGAATVADNLSVPGGLAISGTTLFWSEAFSTIKSCDVTTVPCTSTLFATATDDAGSATFPSQLLVSGGNLFWFEQFGTDRAILTCPVTGCSAGYPKTALYAGTGTPLSGAATSGLTTDGSYVYITLFSGGPILRYGMLSATVVDPTNETGLASTPSGTHVLDLDGTMLRWAESGNGVVAACMTPGCPAITDVATGRVTPYAVTHDATYVYGVDQGNEDAGAVLWRVAK